MNKLVEVSILSEVTGSKRDRLYCAMDILDILEEPAKLTPNNTSAE